MRNGMSISDKEALQLSSWHSRLPQGSGTPRHLRQKSEPLHRRGTREENEAAFFVPPHSGHFVLVELSHCSPPNRTPLQVSSEQTSLNVENVVPLTARCSVA